MRTEKERKKKLKAKRRRKLQPKSTKFNAGLTNGVNKTLSPFVEDSSSLISGSRKRARVEFVYPRALSGSSSPAPYVFDKIRKDAPCVNDEGKEGTTKSHPDQTQQGERFSESIDDILFGGDKRKEKKKQFAVEVETEAKATSLPSEAKDHAQEQSSAKEHRHEKTIPQSSETHDDDSEGGRLSGLSVEDAVRDKLGCRPRSNSTDGELNLPRRGLCDERMVLESYKWRTNGHAVTPKGFMNLGNTCFLNATLQCLAYLPTFSQCLTSLPGSINGQKMSHGQRMTTMLSNLFRQVHGVKGAHAGGDAISPRGIVKAVPSLGSSGSRTGYKFRPGRQEDAHEFLVHLLDAMQDGELKAAGINQHASGWRERLPIPRLDETTFIYRIFGGYLRSQVRCTKCGYCSNTYDPFLDLSLEVSKKSVHSIATAFAEFTRKETLDSANRWKCSGCKKHVCATKQLTVFRPPLTLCMPLKRFAFGGGFGSMGGWGFGHYGGKGMGTMGRGGSKITKPIEFPAEMKLPLSDGRRCEYHLTGVVVHMGGSASSGHYTAFVKKPIGGKHQWYNMDDSFVDAVSEKTVLRQKDAYVLFYCRKEVKIEYPSPPPRASMSAVEAREHGLARARARAESFDKGGKETVTSAPAVFFSASPLVPRKISKEAQSPAWSTETSASPSGSQASVSSSDVNTGSVNGEKSMRLEAETHSSSSPDTAKPRSEDDSSSSAPSSTSGDSDSETSLSAEVESSSGKTGLQSDAPRVGPDRDSPHPKQKGPSNSSKLISSASATDDTSDTSSSDSSEEERTRSKHVVTKPRKPTAGPSKILASDKVEESLSSSSASDTDGSSDSDSNSSDSSGNDSEDSDQAATSRTVASTSSTPEHNRGQKAKGNKTRVVLDRGGMRGKLEVLLGPRRRAKAWKPKATLASSKNAEQELLGSVGVGKWDDDEDETGDAKTAQSERRMNALKQLEKQDRSRKRKMHLDRWDAMLDEGKQKKIKTKQDATPMSYVEPKKNPFHKIQSSLQRMNRGQAKGLHRKKTQTPTPKKGPFRRRSF